MFESIEFKDIIKRYLVLKLKFKYKVEGGIIVFLFKCDNVYCEFWLESV